MSASASGSGRVPRVAVLGTGRSGSEIVRACALHPDVELVGGLTTTAAKDGADLGQLTTGERLGIPFTTDLDELLARDDVDAVLHTGLGEPAEVAATLARCARAGKDAITVAGLVHPPTALGAEGAAALDRAAREGGARVVGTGVNPGFLLDALVASWGTMVNRVDRVHALRVSDTRNWGAGALEDEVGVGKPPDAVAGNTALSLDESLALVADALRLRVDRVEDVHEVVPAPTAREHAGRRVEVGQTVGFRRRSRGYRGGDVVAEIEWLAIFCLDPEHDGRATTAELTIEGDARVTASAAGTFLDDPTRAPRRAPSPRSAPSRACGPASTDPTNCRRRGACDDGHDGQADRRRTRRRARLPGRRGNGASERERLPRLRRRRLARPRRLRPLQRGAPPAHALGPRHAARRDAPREPAARVRGRAALRLRRPRGGAARAGATSASAALGAPANCDARELRRESR